MVGMKSLAFLSALLLLFCVSLAFGQQMDVKIIGRRTSDTSYDYQVAGHAISNSNGGCSGTATGTDGDTANVDLDCSSTKTTTYTAPRDVSYTVTGATLSLLLPDGRVAVVNCASKFSERFAGRAGNHRSCRMPLVDDIQADFNGKNAKLSWVVSLDGKKRDSETYKILAVLPKQ
jgi:hypothetical protein